MTKGTSGQGDNTNSIPFRVLDDSDIPDGSCAGCGAGTGRDGEALLRCSGCKRKQYCGRECQKQHWKKHKSHCPAWGIITEKGLV